MREMIIESLYKELVGESEYLQSSGKSIDELIESLLKEKKQQMSQEKYEEYREIIYQVSNESEKSGFVAGFRYAVILMMECCK